MSYVDRQLSSNERVVFATRLHWINLFGPLLTMILAALVGIALLVTRTPGGIALLAVSAVIGLGSYLAYTSSEFAVTDRRVIIKVGLISRRTMETLLSKVEGVQVDQGVLGRMLDYGTIRVIGTGGTREEFNDIAHPLDFRRHVQEEALRVVAPAGGATLPKAADPVEQLERLARLREQGAITDAEFELQKRRILG